MADEVLHDRMSVRIVLEQQYDSLHRCVLELSAAERNIKNLLRTSKSDHVKHEVSDLGILDLGDLERPPPLQRNVANQGDLQCVKSDDRGWPLVSPKGKYEKEKTLQQFPLVSATYNQQDVGPSGSITAGGPVGSNQSVESTESACASAMESTETNSLESMNACRETMLSTIDHVKSEEEKSIPPDDEQHGVMSWLVATSAFDYASALMILANAAFVTLSTDSSVANHGVSHEYDLVVEICFLLIFSLELLFRVIAHGRNFVTGADKLWRLLDCVVVVAGSLDLLISLIGQTWINISVIRCLRVVKAARALRLWPLLWGNSRVRLLGHLFKDVLGSLCTVLALAAFLVYIFAGLFLQIMSTHVSESDKLLSNQSSLMQRWGSTSSAMLSLLAAATTGELWLDMAEELRLELGVIPFIAFLAYLNLFVFVLCNMIMATFMQSTLLAMEGSAARELQVAMELESKDVFINQLEATFGPELDKEEFLDVFRDAGERSQVMQRFRHSVGLSEKDLERIFSLLSDGGHFDVPVEKLVIACIVYKGNSSKLDVVELLATQRNLMQEACCISDELTSIKFGHMGTLREKPGHKPLLVTNVAASNFVSDIVKQAKKCSPSDTSDQDLQHFSETLKALAELLLKCSGGGGFVVASAIGYEALGRRKIAVQACDRSPSYPKGYMNEASSGLSLKNAEFCKLLKDFLDHHIQVKDRWPPGHPAAHLPKDGFTLLGVQGSRRLCAARLMGLPQAPYSWEGVGTRHMAAMNMAWALRGHLFAVVVRSESGHIHYLFYHPLQGLLCSKVNA